MGVIVLSVVEQSSLCHFGSIPLNYSFTSVVLKLVIAENLRTNHRSELQIEEQKSVYSSKRKIMTANK